MTNQLDDLAAIRSEGHRLLDIAIDHLENIGNGPVWRPMDRHTRDSFSSNLPIDGSTLGDVTDLWRELILPFHAGNAHPRFMGWVQGGGLGIGLLSALAEAAMNANCGGRDHAAIAVEAEVTNWMRQLFRFPESASGVFVTGTSHANLLAVIIASRKALGLETREDGLGSRGGKLRGYASSAVHSCVPRAFDAAGLGAAACRKVATDVGGRMDLKALRQAVEADRASGLQPFIIVATAGSVDTGAIDNLEALADFARDEGLWLHVDAAYAALGMLSEKVAPLLCGLERADSIAFDFHKWTQIQYEAGFLLVRDGARHKATFATNPAYLRRAAGGLAAGETWPTDMCLDLSRSFKALKVWMAFKTLGARRLGDMIDRSCELARYLARKIESAKGLELMSTSNLNIVCFRVVPEAGEDGDELNETVAISLQESGVAAPSTTTIEGKRVLRAALFNHRTREDDLDVLVTAAMEAAAQIRSRRRGA